MRWQKHRNNKRREEEREGKNVEITREEKEMNTETKKEQERVIWRKRMRGNYDVISSLNV